MEGGCISANPRPQFSTAKKRPAERRVVAVFDFDGTLTRRDTLLPFLRYISGHARYWWSIVLLSPVLISYGLRLIPNWIAKEIVLVCFLRRSSEQDVRRKAEKFASEYLGSVLRPEAVRRLRWHQQQGHLTLLISASLELYLKPWAEHMGFDHVHATRLQSVDGMLTGVLGGNNCYGVEKVVRLKAALGDLNQYELYVYGDSRGDRELLAAATRPFYRTFENPLAICEEPPR